MFIKKILPPQIPWKETEKKGSRLDREQREKKRKHCKNVNPKSPGSEIQTSPYEVEDFSYLWNLRGGEGAAGNDLFNF